MPIDRDPNDHAQPVRLEAERMLLARRRLLKGGLGVAPVLATVVSRPVYAGECMSASAWTSVTRSGPQHNNFTCGGGTPGYWGVEPHLTEWPSPFTTTTKFHKAYGGPFGGTIFGTHTLLEVINSGGGAPTANEVGRHIIAALFNAKMGWTNALTVPQVYEIWDEYVASGYGQYSPTAGVVWYSAEITAWMATTMQRT
jgi:hypothetical protein